MDFKALNYSVILFGKRERTAVSRNASWTSLCYIDANYLTTDIIQYGYSLCKIILIVCPILYTEGSKQKTIRP